MRTVFRVVCAASHAAAQAGDMFLQQKQEVINIPASDVANLAWLANSLRDNRAVSSEAARAWAPVLEAADFPRPGQQ